ncbi:MAG: SH3 domain-containing protein [Gemmatimonadaceae bacterium]|nr:SH3 domain-containing protein [Gemmatimonadaceae bacterium]
MRLALGVLCAVLLAGASAELKAQDSTAVVTTTDVRLRRAPSISATILETLPKDATVVIRRRDGAWAEVEFLGNTGWVRAAQLRVTGPASPRTSSAPAGGSPPPSSARTPEREPPRPAPPRDDESRPAVSRTRATSETDGFASRPRVSIEASGLQRAFGVEPGGTNDQPAVNAFGTAGFGFDVQGRIRFGALSLGGGFLRSSHELAQFVDGNPINATWSGPFGEMRLQVPLGRRLDVFLTGRGGLASGQVQGESTDPTTSARLLYAADVTGWHAAGGGGVGVRLTPNISLVASGLYGLIRSTESESDITLQTADGQEVRTTARDETERRGRLRTIRVGLALGF